MNKGAYLTYIFSQSSIRPSYMVILQFENFENLERASVSLWMLSAKQGNHWYHFLTSLVWRGLYQGLNPGPSALKEFLFLLFCQLSLNNVTTKNYNIPNVIYIYIYKCICMYLDQLDSCFHFFPISWYRYHSLLC